MPHFTTSDGVRLHYLDEGAGLPVVLVAGFMAPATSWFALQEALLAAGYRVLALDRRGHGASEDPPFGARMSRHGQDLADFLAALDLTDVHLVGGSMGASTIWAYLDLQGTRRVRSIVTVDQTPKMLNSSDWSHGFYGFTADNMGTLFADGVPDTGRGMLLTRRPDLVDVVARLLPHRARAGDAPPRSLSGHQLALLLDHAVQDWRDVVARLDVPSLFVAGRDSEYWPPAHATAAAADNSCVDAVVIDDCGHAVNLERAAEFNAVALEFIAGH